VKELTKIDLNAAPVQRVGKVIPDIGFVGQLEDVVVTDSTGFCVMLANISL
jgi:hypothetical protein